MESEASAYQLLVEFTTVVEVVVVVDIFQEFVFDEDAGLGVKIVIGSREGLPGEAGSIAVSAGLEAIDVKTGGFGKVTTGASANVGLESLIAELEMPLVRKAPELMLILELLVRVTTPLTSTTVESAPLCPSIVEHVFFECEADLAGSENVTEFETAKETGVSLRIDRQNVPIGVGEASGPAGFLIDVGSEQDPPIKARPINLRGGGGAGAALFESVTTVSPACAGLTRNTIIANIGKVIVFSF